MTEVVLASASPARLAVLRAAGLDPRVQESGVDEAAILSAVGNARFTAKVSALATAKARAVATAIARGGDRRETVVLGCDSMLELGGLLLGKPLTAAVARERWHAMRAASGILHTGHAVFRVLDGRIAAQEAASRSTTVRFVDVTPQEIDAYVGTGEPLDVAGAFTIDGYGGWFVDAIEGDPSNVIGISLPLVRQLLAAVGVPVTSLWRPRG